MSPIKSQVKNALPQPVVSILNDTRDNLERVGELPGAYLHPWRRESIRKLEKIRNQHRGERCFIIGNGPSLKNTDLSRLKNEYTIGMNRFYLAFPDLGFTSTYYLSVNDLVIEQCAADIRQLNIPTFLSWRNHNIVGNAEHIHYLYTTYTSPKFSVDAATRLWEGATVTYVALQLAFHLGFGTAILIGVDHNFTTQGKPNTTVVSQGDDPNHFHPNYFGKGFRWQLPDLETSEKAYRMALAAYQLSGRKVIDATVGGKLRVFPRQEYESLFA